MKGKFKGKILNLRNIIVSLIIVVIAAVSGISIVQYNSRNVQTNLGKAQTSNYPITGRDLVGKALKYIGQNKECSGLLVDSLKDLGATPSCTTSAEWNAGNFKYTFNGTEYSPKELGTTSSNGSTTTKWFGKVENPDNLEIGTVISGSGNAKKNTKIPYGSGHVFIYLGKANSYNDLKSNLKTRYNLDLPVYNANYIDAKDIDADNGGSYWYIEGNATTNMVKIRNFSWKGTIKGAKNLTYVRVWKITQPKGHYKIGVFKLSTNNDKIGGAKFTIEQKISGNWKKPTGLGNSSNEITCNGGTNGNFGQLYDTDVNEGNSWDTYRIKETAAPSGYKISYTGYVYLSLYKESWGNKYQVTKIRLGTSENQCNEYDLKTKSETYEVNDSVSVQAHKGDDGEIDNVINFVVKDEKEENFIGNTYNATITKIDADTGASLDANFRIKSNKINIINPNFSTGSMFYTYDQIKNAQIKYSNNEETYVDSGKKISNTDITIGSNDGAGVSRIYANALSDIGEHVSAGNKYSFVCDDKNGLSIKDTFDIEEWHSPDGYIKDEKVYSVDVIKSYNTVNYNGKFGHISEIHISHNGKTAKLMNPTNGTKLSLDNLDIYVNEKNGGFNFDIKFKNKKITGSYNLYIGKKSSYNDYMTDASNNFKEITCSDNLAGAKFKVEMYLNGASYPDTRYIESVDKLWNDGKEISVNITNTTTDRFYIEEVTPPTGYNYNKVKKIWIDVHKKESDNKYVIDYIDYTFRDEKDEVLYQKRTNDWGASHTSPRSGYNTGFMKLDNDKLFCIFMNDKQYSLNISKRDKNNNIISSPESSNASFSIKMFKTFSNTNGHISLSDNREIYSNSDIDMNNIKTVDGQISLNNLSLDREWLHKDVKHSYNGESYDAWDFEAKTLYYLITENTPPNGYNSIGSLILGIHFDENGNSTLDGLYHVEAKNGGYDIIKSTEGLSSNLTVNVGNDGISANANSTNNIINIDIQQPDHEDSYYDLQLEKKDASDNNQLAGVKFKVSNVKINNSDIKSNNNENAFSITSKETVSNVINEIYTNANDDSKNKIGEDTKVLNSNDTTDTYTIEETESITGYELNTIKTNLKFYKKNENSNIKNDHASVVFDTKNADGNYVSGNELQITDGYFVSSLDSTASTNDDRKVENLDNYIDSLKNENIVIVYYAKGKISVQYYNKLEGTYSVVLNKYVNNRVSNDSSINFNISLYKNKNSNNEFSETDEIKEVQTEKGTVKLSDLTTAQSITDSLQEIFITENEIGKTYYYVLEETKTRNDLIKLDYKIVIPFKFVKDEYNEYVVTNAEEKGFGLKNNEKIEIRNGGLIHDNENACYIIGESGLSLMQIMVNNFEKEGNYNLKLLKIKAKDGFTADLLSQLKNANSINDLNALAKSGARFGVKRTTRGGSSVSENTQDITSEEGKVKDVYDGQLDINEDDMNFNPEYNEENGGDAKLDYGTSRFTIDEWSATGTGMKVNKAISNLEIETKLSRGTDKYSLTDVKVYDKTQNKEITADEAFTKYGLFVKIMNSEDGTPILITAVADDVITGEFSFNLKKVNSKTGKELTAEECNGMKFNFGLYQGGDSYDNPGTKVTELTKKDGTTVNISNLTTLQEINDAMSNIEITEEMDKQTTYRLIIEETEAPADFVKFNHKIGCTLISNQDENEEYKMIYTDFKVYDGKYWQYYSQYEEVDFNQTDSINTLTLTLKNVPKTGSYNLDVEKVDLSGNDIKDETTRFSVKAYSSLYNRTDGKFALEASSRIEIKDKKENILTATDGKSTELRDIQINKEDIGKTYYFVIEETDAPYQFTKLNYKIVVPITFSENENEYKASKCEAYAFVKDESISDSSYEDKAVYIKKSLSEVATSQKETVSVEQNQDSTTINVKVPNKSEYTLKIKKVSAGTREALSNVQFNLIGAKINGTALKDSDNQEITTSHFEPVTTGTDGSVEICGNTSVPNPVSITSIESDEYYFTEETEPDGHRKLPDNVAIELLVKKGSDGKVNELNILVVNKNDKSIIQKGRYALTYIINEYGDTVTISAVKTADNEIILTVSDPEDTRNGNYNLYLLKKDNNNTVLSGVNFELIGAKVSNKEIISVDSPKDAKAIVTGTDKVSVYTNAKDENGNDVIQINNTNLEEDDEFILREKDLGSNNGYTQLPSNYKIKVKIQKSEGNNKYFVSGTTLELYNENNQIVSPKENTEDEYEINGVTYKISLEKSGSNIILTVENPKVNGEYKLNVIKKDINKQGYVSGFDSFGTNSVAGAKFNITLYKNVILNYKDFNIGSSFGNKVRFGSYTTKGTTEDLNHDNFKRTEITYSEIEQNRIDIWRIAETDPPTGFESMKNDLVLGIEKTYDEKTKQFYIDTIHIYQLNGDGTITWDPQSYEEINKADGSVMYTYVSSDNDTWQIMLNKDRTQIAVSADNIPNGEYRLNVMKKITDDNSAGDTADSAKSGASFNIQLYKDIDLNSSNFKFGSDNNPNNFENFTQDENEYISYETKGNAEDLTNDKFKRTGITTDSVGNKYDIWKINEWSAPDGLDTYSGQLVLGVKKKYNSDSHTFSIESITMYKVDGNGIKSSNNVWEAQTVHDVNNSNADSTEMNTYTTYSYFDTDSTGNNIRRWDFVIKNNSQIYVTLHNNPTEYGSYNVNLVKHDEYGNNISGVKFMAIREVNGGAPEAIYTEQNPLVTSYTNVNIGGTVNIDGTKVNTDDVYTLKELDLDENSEYTKIPGNIKLTVKKATRKNSNYSKTHYVERIQLRLVSDDGQKVITPTENLFNKQVIETTINGEKANITAELIDNTITITVVNPDKTGLYSLDLTKVEKGTNTPLDGAEFEVKYYNSMSTQNETESVNVLNSDGTISTIKTSEIKTVADFKKLQNIIVNESTAPFSYWIIKETKAPAGHDLLKYKIEIRIFKQSTSDGYKVSSDRARALYEDGTNKLLEDLTEDEPKTTITEDKESSTYKLNINVENAITPKGTYSLNLNKVDKATKSNLTGAEFEVSLKSGRTKIPSVTIVNDDNTETTIDLSTIKSVDDFNKLKNIKITSEGRFVWQIKETKAPEGFKKLDYYISIIFNSTNVNNNYVIKKVSADAIYESDGSYRSTPIEALDKNEPQTTITETTTGTYQANITIENNSYGGSYKLSLMKKNEADASHDIYSNGDDSRSALAGATFDVKLYKNIQKNNSNFEFNSQYNEENKGPYTTVGADDLSESNEIVRDGLTSSGFDSNYYDIWKIEETKAPGGYIKMTEPLVLGVEKNYDSTTNTFTINDIYVYQKNSNGLKSDGGKWVVLPVTNKEGNTAHGEDGNAMVKNSTYIFEQDGNKWSLVLSADKTRMIVTAFDKKISKFNFKLIKKEQGAEKTLPGALFEITIKDENGNQLKTASGTEINKYQQTTSAAVGGDSNGTIKINDILIDGENKKYTVEITELLAPAGYEKIMDTISFQVTSKLADDGSYMLTPGDYTVANTKQCEVDESGNVIVTVEDKKTEKVEFAIYKKWENVNDTELPESITVELYQVPENKLDAWNIVKDSAKARQEYLYRGAHGTGGRVTLTKDNAVNGNNLMWYYKWTDLSKENTDTKVKNIYYVIETEGPEGFITTYEPNNYKSPDVNTVTITNTIDNGSYKLSLMKKDEADASHDIYSNGDDSRSALAGATFDVKLYKNIQKNNSNFEFNNQYNEENKGPYTTVGADDLSEQNEIVRDGLTSNGYSTGDYYDIWKIEETSAPDGYVKMTSPLVLGVEKKYDSKTRTFTINDIYVYQKNSNGLKSDGGKWVVLPVTNKEGNTAHGEDGNVMVKNSTYIFEQDGNTWSLVLSSDKTKMIVTAFDKKEEEGQYDLNIQKRSTSGEILNGVEFSLMSAKVNNETVKNSKGETATNEKFVTSSVGIANVPSLTSVPNPIKITDVDNADVYVFRETNLPESIKNKYAKLPDYVSIELTVNKGREEVDGKTQLVAKSVSVKVIDNRTKKEYVGNRNNMVEYSFESNGKTYTAQIKASISNNTVTLTVENPDIPPEGEYKLSLVKAGNDERLGGVKFNLISARVNNGTIQNGSSSVSEDNPIVITTNAQKPVGIWPTDGSSMKILSATSDEYILKEADLCNNNKYVKLPDNKLIKLVILKEETNNEFKVSSINMYVGNDTDGWEPATYIFNEAHNMIIEARSTVTDSKGNEFTISFARSGDNLTLTVEDPKEETTKYTVSKKWDDANKTDSRPDYVEFRLFGFAKNDAEAQKIYNDLNNSLQSKAYKMISSKIKDKSILQYKCTGDINVRADDGWQEATWYNLSKDYNYFAWEISDIDGYDITNAEVSNNNTKLTITNTKDTTKYTIQKVWAEGTEMPKNLEVRLYSFDKDSQDYNELVGYVNSKDYDKINEKVKTLTPSGQSVYLWADTNWSHTWGGLDKDRSYFAWEVDKDALVKYNITNAEISEEGTKMTITNTKPVSKFNLTLVKYEQGSDKTLSGALFEITIKDENGNPLKTVNGTEINKYQQTTSATYGRIGLDDLIIDGADKKYTVEITEVLAPAGYERIMDTISFQVTSKLADDGSYMLTPGDYTVANTKQCEVDESGNVIVNVEDKKTDKTEFAIYKKWENVKDTELPDSITVELYQVPENKLDAWNIIKEEADARQEYLYRGAYGSGGRVTLTKDNAINSSTWYYKWTDLSKENNDTKVKNIYYVIETDGPEGFITTYEPNNYKSPDVNTVTITNTKETTQYTIQKVWDKNVQTSSMPRTLQVSLFAFNKNDENDTKLYNELIGYVNNKQYNEINNKIAELTDKKVGSSIGLSAGNQWSFTWSELSKDNNYFAWETDANALSKFNITNAVISDEGTKMTITNTQPEGSFKLKLIKKLTNTNITLANAKFTLSIKDEAGNELIPNTSYEYKTDANGEIVVDKLAITGPNKEYTVTIKETKAPAGYAKLTDEVSFKVKSHAKADGSGFELIANDLTPIKNAKDAKVTEDGIEVTIYNDLTSPHKGVKDIKNQDSGYYDNVTGKVYTSKEEVASTLHDWVIQTTIPEGITAYTTYEISDEINEKLVFAGLDTVKVKYVNGADLTKDKDYKVTYDEASRMLKVTFIDESFKGGYNLEVGKDVEIRFNTTFALDNDGNIIAINEEVPNQAKLTYGNDSNNKQTKLTEIPEVHTGGVGIYKYDKKTNKALEGAHFKIATSKENALAGIFVKDGNGQDIEKVTNSNGLAEFAGLEFGEDALNKAEYETYDSITGAKVYKYDTSKLSTTYYLVETESPKGYLKLEKPVEVVVKVGSYDMKDITSLVQVGNEEGIYDLSLRKFITAVKDTAKGTEEEVTSRIPQVDLTKLASGESTTATYTHPKDPVLVHTTDIVTYTIRIYNEGPQDAYASIVKDDIPDGLQFVQYTEGDGSLNAEYRWKLVDENDNEVTDVSKAKYIVTDYLSKEQDKTPGANLLKAYKPETMSELDYRDVKVQFKVTEPTTSDRILINYAQISKETDSSGRVVRDRDSTPNVWVEGEDDQDIEKVRVQYFDLALRKWVTQAIVTENGKTVVTQTGHKAEDDPEEVVKVDLKKSKINNVVVKFRYSIRITNEGEIAGEATEIRDDIPQGLKFVAEDNQDWREENGQIVTNKLEHTTLQPGESAEVEILLTWINSANNMGVMTNVAEINKDHNDYGAPDIDSTPGNNVPGEDDIDDAPVMLTVKTGSEYILYASIALSAIAVIAVGGKVIKKKVMRNI